MKIPIVLLLASTAAVAATEPIGGAWKLRSHTIDGGGRTSNGGVWSATTTIGQADATAATASGGSWAAQGGFWPGTLAEPGGPALAVVRLTTTHVAICWGKSAVGYRLQSSTDLKQWTDSPGLTITSAGSLPWPITTGPRQFFRLKKLP